MGRLPGGIIDGYREHYVKTAAKHVESQQMSFETEPVKTPQRVQLKSSQDSLPRSSRSGRSELQSSRLASSLPGIGTPESRANSKFRLSLTSPNFALRYPLRKSRDVAPRNFVVNLPLKGHYATVPGLNIGHTTFGAVGEYTYKLEGEPSPRDILMGPNPPFRFSSPAKRLIGPSLEGLFSSPPWKQQGPPQAHPTWESASNRFISQTLYPLQVLPTTTLS